MENEAKYITLTAAIAFALFTALAAINYTIDPLSYLRANLAYAYHSNERELKSMMVDSGTYDGLLIGTSKITYINPADLKFRGKILNAAFSGAMPEEILYFLEEKNPKVKWIGLGLDPFVFNESAFPFNERKENLKYFSKSPLQILTYLLSLDTGMYSLGGIARRAIGKSPLYHATGARNATLREKLYENREDASTEKTLETIRAVHFGNYRLSERRIRILQDIQLWADRNNVRLIVWLDPVQQDVAAIIHNQMGADRRILTAALRRSFHTFIDLSDSFPKSSHYFKKDPFHYRPETGAEFFNLYILPVIEETGRNN